MWQVVHCEDYHLNRQMPTSAWRNHNESAYIGLFWQLQTPSSSQVSLQICSLYWETLKLCLAKITIGKKLIIWRKPNCWVLLRSPCEYKKKITQHRKNQPPIIKFKGSYSISYLMKQYFKYRSCVKVNHSLLDFVASQPNQIKNNCVWAAYPILMFQTFPSPTIKY